MRCRERRPQRGAPGAGTSARALPALLLAASRARRLNPAPSLPSVARADPGPRSSLLCPAGPRTLRRLARVSGHLPRVRPLAAAHLPQGGGRGGAGRGTGVGRESAVAGKSWTGTFGGPSIPATPPPRHPQRPLATPPFCCLVEPTLGPERCLKSLDSGQILHPSPRSVTQFNTRPFVQGCCFNS